MYLRFFPLLAIVALVLPGGAEAQSANAPPNITRVAELIARAEHPRTGLAERAALLEEASALLPDDDPRASGTLRAAGHTLHRLRNYRRALVVLECAADLANERGSLSEAADTYLDAMFIAREINARMGAQHFMDRAFAVTTNRLMAEPERLRVRRQLEKLRSVHGTDEEEWPDR